MANDADKILGAMDKIEKNLDTAVSRQDEEIKKYGQATEVTGKSVDELTNKLADLHKELEGERESRKNLEGRLETFNNVNFEGTKSVGERFVESEEYKQYVTGGTNGRSKSFELNHSLGAPEAKATVTGASIGATAAYLSQVARVAEYVKDPDRPRFVRELLPTFGVSTGAVEFTRETGFTNSAGMVPEYVATDTTNKPESGITFDIVTVPVRQMAHWIPMTRQAIDDVRQLRAYIENRLFYGLKLKEDQQILYGSGASNELQGILTQTGIQAILQGDVAESSWASDTKIDVLRRALRLAWVDEYRPSGIVVNHADWEDVELTKGSDGHYIYVRVQDNNATRMWGVPVVVSNAIAAGTALVGDFERGTAIHDRENAVLRITDSHSDFFTKNLWALLAEERLAQTIYRPSAFVEVTFN